MDNRDNPFPHDGEGGHSCTGYGCNCDEKTMDQHQKVAAAVVQPLEWFCSSSLSSG